MDNSSLRAPAGVFDRDLGMRRQEVERFLSEPRVSVLSWLGPSGSISATPMWFLYRDGVFLLHTGHPSPKTEAILADDRVTLVVQDEAPPYRYLSVRGRARLRHEAEAALRLYREQALTYYGRLTGRLYLRRALSTFTGEHVIIELSPEKVLAVNARRAVGPLALAALRVARGLRL